MMQRMSREDEDLNDAERAEVEQELALRARAATIARDLGLDPHEPPMLGGGLGDRFDVVTTMSGLSSFDSEYRSARTEELFGVAVKVLPLDRIAASKRAAARPKDALAVKLIEDTIAIVKRV